MSPTPQEEYSDELKPYWKAEKRAKRAVALLEMREGGPAETIPQPLDGKRKRKGKLIELMGLGPAEDEAPTSKAAAAKRRQFSRCKVGGLVFVLCIVGVVAFAYLDAGEVL
ncbi:hypothetical protein BOTBODRAFT_357148 [Botryobasidium botryosum FD-172 SS1]|uniref:Uncharacterized protein n=1 Tax=Botryobasidium botryosum (strain FD-172 SS1) TaxID=930990 RepID=A0A067MQY5_BOTB1|nr:hypothetical protein BOTBODRAFT_357148 [Botryobasidium botryosum FD-172 SS1]